MKLHTTVPVALIALFGLSVVTTTATAVTWHVNPEGTGATPDLQSALDMAKNGDTVLLEPGTYTGPGNRQVRFRGKAVLVTSVSGAASTIIDCEGLGRGFIFNEGESTNSIVDGGPLGGRRRRNIRLLLRFQVTRLHHYGMHGDEPRWGGLLERRCSVPDGQLDQRKSGLRRRRSVVAGECLHGKQPV